MSFAVKLLTPSKAITISNANYVSLPTNNGFEGFLHNHQDDSYVVSFGLCKVISGNGPNFGDLIQSFQLSQGHAKFENNELVIVVHKFDAL